MPELPEVETVRRGLEPHLSGAKIRSVEARRADLRFPLPPRFAERLCGQTITGISRRAKYLVLTLQSGETLIMHLGMTGRFTVVHADEAEGLGDYVYQHRADPRHDHIIFHLGNGSRVIYNDPRRFGFMLLIGEAEQHNHPLLSGLGVEPLGPELTGTYLADRVRNKKVNLKAFLMDQRIVAGLGNIYASEALWRSGLNPHRLARTLVDRRGRPNGRAEALVLAIRSVLVDAIKAGGSTLRDYRDADGQSGNFQEAFAVYNRDGEPCIKPGCGGVVRRTIQSGRASYACGRCQK